MITYETLENVDIETITKAFNEAFSDYSIPLQLTYEQMQTKLKAENYAPEYSVGAFYQNKLIGFILHCYREENGIKKVYNGGTGVIPTQRGQHITLGMYDFILPYIKESGVKEVILEVLENNLPAKKSYEKVGFKRTRRFRCYSGNVNEAPQIGNVKILEIAHVDWHLLESFWTIEPSWQNASQSIRNIREKLNVYGAYIDTTIVGYIVFNPSSRCIQHIAVSSEFRRQGIATSLLNYIREHNSPEVSIINVDEQESAPLAFLESQGLENKINLLEMKLGV